MTRRAPLALALVSALAGCSQAGLPPTNVAFARPGKFAFGCFDLNTSPPDALPLSSCVVTSADADATGRDLHAIVLQTATGQVALVDVQANATSALIDSNPTVPGYTFLSVGERPIDIVASDGKVPGQPLTTYIAHAGTRDLWWVPTRQLRAVASDLSWQTLDLGGEPTAMILSPDETYLFVALEDLGVVRQYRIDPLTGSPVTGMPDSPLDVLLPAVVPPAVGEDPTMPVATPEPWGQICPFSVVPVPTTLSPRTPRSAGTAPNPVALALDAASMPPRLIVADSALPVLHVLPLGSAGLDATAVSNVNVGTPTTAVVVTPAMPATLGTALLDDRYVYAIDDRGDILVVDWTEGAPTFGGVLPVDAATSRAPDRIAFGSVAQSIEVVTPGGLGRGPIDGGAPFCSIDTATMTKEAVPGDFTIGPGHMRGVFLAVGLSDGTVRMVDVWDHDALCRGVDGSTPECTAATGADTGDAVVYIRRHRPRIGALLSAGPTVTAPPALTLPGTTGSSDAALEALGSCPPSLVPGFPAGALPEETQVCIGVDPWNTIGQVFTATYEGALVYQTLGYFDDDPTTRLFHAPGVDFCQSSAIGNAEAALASGIPSFQSGVGDQLVIVGDPDADLAMTDACAPYVADGVNGRVSFEILHTYADGTLELGPELANGSGTPPAGDTFAAALGCFTQLVGFEVRTRGSWLVRGSSTGVLNRVRAGASGVCAADPADTTLDGLESRAYVDMPFASRETAFEIGGSLAQTPGTILSFTVGTVPPGLAVSVGSLPWAMRYSPVDQDLYVVDAVIRGLSRVALDGYTIAANFSSQGS